MYRFASAALIAALGFAISTATFAAKSEDAIEYRKGVMAAQGWNFGAMGAMVKGERPYDKAEFLKRAENLAALSKMSLEGFTVEGSEKGKTKAKAEVFLDAEKFKGGMDKLATESAKLVTVAQGGDMAAIKPQFNEVAKVCKGCHDNFRSK